VCEQHAAVAAIDMQTIGWAIVQAAKPTMLSSAGGAGSLHWLQSWEFQVPPIPLLSPPLLVSHSPAVHVCPAPVSTHDAGQAAFTSTGGTVLQPAQTAAVAAVAAAAAQFQN
jgi:hypothetical protein